MQAREHLEEVAVLRRRVRHARIPEQQGEHRAKRGPEDHAREDRGDARTVHPLHEDRDDEVRLRVRDRKSTRLNSSHLVISYAVFCLKKKKKNMQPQDTRYPLLTHSSP